MSSTIILTASTLMFLSPQSLIAVFLSQAGCLLLVARFSSLKHAGLPESRWSPSGCRFCINPSSSAIPIGLGLLKMLGYGIKIGSVNAAKGPTESGKTKHSPDDFLAAEQVLISVLALAVAGVFGIVALQLNITPPNETGPVFA